MDLRVLIRFFASIAAAILASAALYSFSVEQLRAERQTSALRWARQVGSQAEGMYLAARQEKNRDPLGWTIGLLAQGIEPRALRITKLQKDGFQLTEEHRVLENGSALELEKVLNASDGAGVRIRIVLEEVGFFGIRSRWISDAMFVLVTIGFFFGFREIFGRILPNRGQNEVAEQPVVHSVNGGELRARIGQRLDENRHFLLQLGGSVRELVREARNLVQASAKARESTMSLRNRVHENINRLRAVKHATREESHRGIQAEILSLNLIAELSKSTSLDPRLAGTAEQLHAWITKMSRGLQDSHELLSDVEKLLEPIATDADIAQQSHHEGMASARNLDQHIRQAAENLIQQAKLVQVTRSEVNDESIKSA